jgi:hypothetical protein
MPWQNVVMADARRTPFIPDVTRVKAYLKWVGWITVVFFAVYPTLNWFTDTRAHRYHLAVVMVLRHYIQPTRYRGVVDETGTAR